jgi:glycosyltransferase involved in cell wall biosynthesis
MSILEAMASGRAVVAVDQGGPKSLIVDGRGGVLIDANRPESLAPALLSLLADKQRLVEAGRFNRSRVEKLFSLEVFIDSLETVYEAASARTRIPKARKPN